MPQQDPTAVFEEAQQAMMRSDWDTFFACLDSNDLKRLIRNGLSLALVRDQDGHDALQAICEHHGFPLEEVLAAWHSHQTKPYEKAVDTGLKSVSDRAGFMAALERHTRLSCGGGSVSSSLLVGERLLNLDIQGNKAWGLRQVSSDFRERIGFVARKGQWYIRLFGRRP
jgi:hypothetical protein